MPEKHLLSLGNFTLGSVFTEASEFLAWIVIFILWKFPKKLNHNA